MALFTRGKIWFAADRNSYLEKAGDTASLVIDGTAAAKFGAGKVGFFSTTPIVQRTGAAQAAVGTAAATTTTPHGFATGTQADAIVTLVNEMRSTLVAYGLMKGSA